MASTTTHKGYEETVQSALTTELNSLGNNSNSAASSAIDNTSTLALTMDVELVIGTQGGSRASGGSVVLYIVHALDGSNYDDVEATCAEILGAWPLDAATTARRRTIRDLPIPPGLFKLFVRNSTGYALASSGNTVKYRRHSILVT